MNKTELARKIQALEGWKTQAPYKHNALWEYMQLPENKGKKLHGGIIIRDDFGNWVYLPAPLNVRLGTSDTTNWNIFDPQQYI